MKKTAILAIALASAAMAANPTLTMDEVPIQSINGLAIAKGGVTFTFSNSGGGYRYNAPNGGTLTFLQDPTIEGSTGSSIGVAFSVPVYSVQFGLAEDTDSPVAPIGTVNLYSNSVVPFATLTFNSSTTDPFAEGQFVYSSGTTITNILITPNAGPDAAAIDNLQVDTAPPIPATPAPSSLLLLGAGVLALMFYMARQRFGFGS